MATERGTRPQILVVEDDSAVRRSLQLLLAARGYAVRAHGSARQALADPGVLASQCLIADLVMEDIDGLGLLDALRKRDWQGKAILISGHLDGERTQSARAAGYETILAKPFVDALLVEAVAKAVQA